MLQLAADLLAPRREPPPPLEIRNRTQVVLGSRRPDGREAIRPSLLFQPEGPRRASSLADHDLSRGNGRHPPVYLFQLFEKVLLSHGSSWWKNEKTSAI